jgi:hypothetical protein
LDPVYLIMRNKEEKKVFRTLTRFGFRNSLIRKLSGNYCINFQYLSVK